MIKYGIILTKPYKYEDRYGGRTMTEENPRERIRKMIEEVDDSDRKAVVRCLRQIYQLVMTKRQRERQDPVSARRAADPNA